MNRTYFIKRKTEIKKEIASRKQELKNLVEQYFESNQQFPVGSKVCIITPGCTGTILPAGKKVYCPSKMRYAYIVGYEMRNNSVCFVLMKAKEDGKISKIKDHGPFRHERIELA